MAFIVKNFGSKLLKLGPLLILYSLSITEIDTDFSNLFEILSFNLPLIVVYYWSLRAPSLMGNGHIFIAGIINDVIMSLTLGTSALSFLVVSFVASYIRNVTVNTSVFTEWFTFLIALFFSALTQLILISNFTDHIIDYSDIFYNIFFTMLFFPFFWVIFNFYKTFMKFDKND